MSLPLELRIEPYDAQHLDAVICLSLVTVWIEHTQDGLGQVVRQAPPNDQHCNSLVQLWLKSALAPYSRTKFSWFAR